MLCGSLYCDIYFIVVIDPASLSSWNKWLFLSLKSWCFCLYHFPCLKFIFPHSLPLSTKSDDRFISLKKFLKYPLFWRLLSASELCVLHITSLPWSLLHWTYFHLWHIVPLAPWERGLTHHESSASSTVSHMSILNKATSKAVKWSCLTGSVFPFSPFCFHLTYIPMPCVIWLYGFSDVIYCFGIVFTTTPLYIRWSS